MLTHVFAVFVAGSPLSPANLCRAFPVLPTQRRPFWLVGCFWCIVTYKTHARGGHRESSRSPDDSVISFDSLLARFWRSVDPTDGGGQFCERGFSYSTAVCATDKNQLTWPGNKRRRLMLPASWLSPLRRKSFRHPVFYSAEDYHQNSALDLFSPTTNILHY